MQELFGYRSSELAGVSLRNDVKTVESSDYPARGVSTGCLVEESSWVQRVKKVIEKRSAFLVPFNRKSGHFIFQEGGSFGKIWR